MGGVAAPKSAAPDSGKYRPLVEAALAVEGGCGTSFATSHTRAYKKHRILVLRGLHLHRLSPILLASSIRATFRCRRIRRVSQMNPAHAGGENDAEARDLLQRGCQARGRSVPTGGHQAR